MRTTVTQGAGGGFFKQDQKTHFPNPITVTYINHNQAISSTYGGCFAKVTQKQEPHIFAYDFRKKDSSNVR